MRAFLAMWRKELGSYFGAPVAYVVAAVFLVVSGLNFWRLASQSGATPLGASMMLFGPIFFWVMAILVISVVTMRVFAEERRIGTIETLVTAPVREEAIVLGKYAGALTFFYAASAPTVLFLPLLRVSSSGVSGVDWGPVAGGYLALALSGALYVAVGVLVSALSRSQASAAIVTFAVTSLMFFSEYFTQLLPGDASSAFSMLAASRHAFDFARGSISSPPVVFDLTVTALVLMACVRIIKSDSWRG